MPTCQKGECVQPHRGPQHVLYLCEEATVIPWKTATPHSGLSPAFAPLHTRQSEAGEIKEFLSGENKGMCSSQGGVARRPARGQPQREARVGCWLTRKAGNGAAPQARPEGPRKAVHLRRRVLQSLQTVSVRSPAGVQVHSGF